MYCRKCGNKVEKTDLFCSKCGEKSADITEIETKPDSNQATLLSPKISATNSNINVKNDHNKIKCPKCKSINVIGGKKGFSGTQAVGGAILTGGIGILAGTIGSNKVELSCLSCGNKFKPGHDLKGLQKKKKQEAEAMKSPVFWIFLIVIFGIIIFVFKGCFG
jgi:predicted RNA-binding Zn-ribbon protein involved in translation (DUF1610 family)